MRLILLVLYFCIFIPREEKKNVFELIFVVGSRGGCKTNLKYFKSYQKRKEYCHLEIRFTWQNKIGKGLSF